MSRIHEKVTAEVFCSHTEFRIFFPIFSRRFFREKSLLWSWLFVSVFLRSPELTKIVLPKVLQNFKFHLLAQGTEPKSFPHNIQCRTRPKGPPFQFFFGIARLFFGKKFPKGSPFQFFWRCETFFKKNFSAVEENTLKL